MLNERNQQALTMLMNVLLLVLVVVGVKQGVQAYYTIHPQPTNISERSFVVSAEGEAIGIPDVATFTVSVIEEGETVADVTTAGNEKMTAVLDAVKSKGIDAADIKTTQYSLTPKYNNLLSPRVISGYKLQESATVKVRNLEILSEVVDVATEAGANSVGTPDFEIDDPEVLAAEARTEAFEKAKLKAQALANDAGVKLGEVLTVSETPYFPYQQYDSMKFASALSSDESAIDLPAVDFEAGSQEITISISVTYGIK
jgi:uncharacterized protein YggE